MQRKPTIDDFSALIVSHLHKNEKNSLFEIQAAERKASAKGMLNSGNTIVDILTTVEKNFEIGVQQVLGELQHSMRDGHIDESLLRSRTEAALREFLRRLNNQIGHSTRNIAAGHERVAMHIDAKKSELEGYLNLQLRLFDTGLIKLNEPARPNMVDNSIKIGGNVSGSAIQQGSPDATQTVQVDMKIFDVVRTEIEQKVEDKAERENILKALDEFASTLKSQNRAQGDLVSKYQEFISTAANHMTILAPFLPALTKFIG